MDEADMDNLRADLEQIEKAIGEQIEAVVVGKHDSADRKAPPLPDENIVLGRAQGLAKLDQDYCAGFGSADCFPFYAWTKSWVLFVHEYDGATGVAMVPRHPRDCKPQFSGDSCD